MPALAARPSGSAAKYWGSGVMLSAGRAAPSSRSDGAAATTAPQEKRQAPVRAPRAGAGSSWRRRPAANGQQLPASSWLACGSGKADGRDGTRAGRRCEQRAAEARMHMEAAARASKNTHTPACERQPQGMQRHRSAARQGRPRPAAAPRRSGRPSSPGAGGGLEGLAGGAARCDREGSDELGRGVRPHHARLPGAAGGLGAWGTGAGQGGRAQHGARCCTVHDTKRALPCRQR